MAMTRAQWEAFQRRLPPEDRESYESYIASQQTAEDFAAAGEAALAKADEEARKAREAEEAADTLAKLQKSEEARIAAEAAAAKAKAEADAAAKAAAEQAAKDKADLEARLAKAKADAEAAANARAKAEADAQAQILKAQLEAANAALAASKNINVSRNVPVVGNVSAADTAAQEYAKAQAEKDKQLQRESIMNILTDRFTRYNLQGLIPTIKRLAQEGATESTITMALQETEDYKRRFAANEERIKKGLQVLDPGTYLNAEDRYRQLLRTYGLNQFDNDAYVRQFIENDVSIDELSNRVVTAVQRVRNADPAVSRMLRDYYGIGDTDLVAYVLDPNQQLPKIQRQVAAAEIGAAAAVQGIQPGVSVAEQLAAQGISQAEAQKGYATIANILPGAQRLSEIYKSSLEGYGLPEAEQEVFNTLASAQRKRQKLIERETAAFSGTSGLGRTSLTSQLGGTI